MTGRETISSGCRGFRQPGISQRRIMLEDRNGNIWAGTWKEKGGVYLLNQQTGKFHAYLPGKACPGLFEDQAGVFGRVHLMASIDIIRSRMFFSLFSIRNLISVPKTSLLLLKIKKGICG